MQANAGAAKNKDFNFQKKSHYKKLLQYLQHTPGPRIMLFFGEWKNSH